MDQRNQQLAYNLIHNSIRLKQGEKLLIELIDDGYELAQALISEAYKVGGIPILTIKNIGLQRELLLGATKEQLELIASYEVSRMKDMDAYIAIRGSYNVNQLTDVPSTQLDLYSKYWMKPVHGDIRVLHTKWCVLRYPNPAMAQLANMSTEAFTNFYYDVCNLDYAKMGKAMDALVAKMEATDRVRIVAPGTDLTFSIKGMKAVKCAGECNIPDGEVYTAPVKTSINGVIQYNAPSIYHGITFENVRLVFKDGKIIEATANNTLALEKILDTDEGARYIGEFSLAVNPYINKPMKDILFDEKINGSLHLTPGAAYEDADNGNRSAVHWDLVLIQREEYGGGQIYFDDVLIRDNGRFVVPELLSLNPENLVE